MVEVSDAELAAAKERWQKERAERPIPVSVRFETASARVIVDFANGACFMFPARALEGLQDATAEQLADVELLGETGLHWETLDVDYTISGLMNGIFGSRAFMDAQRKGGQSRSPAKTAASRANGAKGGRPRKMP
ncbi:MULTISPECIES: DUF2442 domain-containing protein [Rhizobium/Agrobacterium group]|uniref:DUF2442 domain-containing protein n=1 Tax=Rhizobium/Agrobacterium group TaxID=227290 RepID=UPI000FDC68D6|nr:MULTISPECIES: DUF2442 domain-containing protein [Rhizobium/Agrobacterium group]MBB4400250.1 hypothetical protein [Agrobacterium radiobacter]MBB5586405.1 hypothetical protein [Agrobacterium radiobacter]RVT70876.1 DUF2442 domain-containing protein [Agrobacterium sp. CNPSo 2736]TGE91857.1 DUF2442 domain-containing protein [Rhizobium sp. SEMIA 4032]